MVARTPLRTMALIRNLIKAMKRQLELKFSQGDLLVHDVFR
jgi:hypothetical protein